MVVAAVNNTRPDAVHLSGGTYWAGSDRHYPEEAPRHLRSVDGFRIAAHPVTNVDFTVFIEDTGYVTDAEKNGSAIVFSAAEDLDNFRSIADCWAAVPNANWRKPDGRNAMTMAHNAHPVVQVTHTDAAAYAKWAGARLPTEAEWEYAASFDQDGKNFIWGDELLPQGRRAANIWARGFPFAREAGLAPWGTSAAGQYAPNPAGLFDMIGNVWEWTADKYTGSHRRSDSCCGTSDGADMRVIKGGSHLCAPVHCQRYRPAARHPQNGVTPTNHIGFRLVWTDRSEPKC
ncbi:SUMF1/EgtB/PvdO family nonheme iron enzyme [Pacificibacter marinus]|uniref:SUMF1/EgtB/PvdO family nonheme iron enzyme n=1 Tax=Pacificibacter marinus TaxID=658057 RepID=UPI001C06F8A8|nr:SUMF1/EgtB/PvdO family nonheme iron enzyme [Pacificibacter marinus]MBU2867293.1 formylglycine-generating enzyme family protein [Pacificibacter marinus]